MSFQALTMLLVVVLLYASSCAAQEQPASQGDNTTVPLTYHSKSVEGDEQVCGPENLRQRLQAKTRDDLAILMRDNLNALVPCNSRNRGQLQHCPLASCSELGEQSQVLRPSRYYWIRSSNGTAMQVFCAMDRVCGCGNTEGWSRIAYLNMTDPSQRCPGVWREAPNRTCGRPNVSSGCTSAYFSSLGISYTRMCGRLVGYQLGATGAFGDVPANASVDTNYVDGVSVTHGTPRQHIWTFAAALGESHNNIGSCPCAYTGTIEVPDFVGQDYFCETGTDTYEHGESYLDDPLWDGQGCRSGNTCCQFNNPPWFCKQLPEATTDDIEVRICANAAHVYEDVLLELVEVYVF